MFKKQTKNNNKTKQTFKKKNTHTHKLSKKESQIVKLYNLCLVLKHLGLVLPVIKHILNKRLI